MLKIYAPLDCANAPKKQLILDFNSLFAKGQVQEIVDYLTDDTVWEMVGDKTVMGKVEIRALLEEMAAFKAKELHIFQIITHGKEASVRGMLKFEGRQIAFADFYEFSSAGSKKIKRIISYAMDNKPSIGKDVGNPQK